MRDVIKELESMLDDPDKMVGPVYFQGYDQISLDRMLEYYLKLKFSTNEHLLVGPVNVNLDLKQKLPVIQIIVFSDVSMNPIPTEFWLRSNDTTGLFRPRCESSWKFYKLEIKKADSKLAGLVVPCWYLEFQAEQQEVNVAEVKHRFEETLFENARELNLYRLIEETVFGRTHGSEYAELSKAMLADPKDGFRNMIKLQHEKRLIKWKEQLSNLTDLPTQQIESLLVIE